MAVPQDAESTPSTVDIDAISSRRFSTSFRGWNPDEVRVHLVEVAELVRSLTQRQGELERLLTEAEAAVRRSDLTRLDPDEVARVMGEETARVLRTARESAGEMEAKANAQAELLTRQAADDAARTRADAETEATRIRGEAQEAAAATRAAGEAHLDDLRAAAEAELAQQRQQMEDALGEERRNAEEEHAALLDETREQVAEKLREAEEEAARTRSEAEEYATIQRSEVDAELAERRAVADQEVQIITERSAAQVAEAERMRERILADLARKRRAARQHLEQLHAGRDRLLTAYEVIRATTDQATGELAVVLDDAKRAAADAARRVGAEDLPTPEEMLAELDLARLADLPIISPGVDEADESGESTPAEPTNELESSETGASEDAPVSSNRDQDSDEPADPESARPTAADGDPESAEPTGTVPVGSDAGLESELSTDTDVSADSDAATQPRPAPAHHRHGRRSKHRHDPLGGETLPDVPMAPVDASAEFENVRIVAAPSASETTAATSTTEKKTPPEPAVATVGRGASAVSPTSKVKQSAEAATTDSGDAVSGIFARLRAERESEPARTPEPKPAQPQSASAATDADDPGERVPAGVGAKTGSTKSAPVATKSAKVESAKPKASTTKAQPTKPKATKAKSASDEPTMPPPAKKARPSGKDRSADGSSDEKLASVFERRDAAVDEAARRLSKHLKRQLSDQQSALLDELRRHRGSTSADEVLGAPDEFAAAWHAVIHEDLTGAVADGVALAGDLSTDAVARPDVDLTATVTDLVDAVAGPLRTRLERALGEGTVDAADASGDSDDPELADRIRACYREWRGARLAASAADACARAFGLGIRAAVPPSTKLCWFCGPGSEPCSDCNDNHLAGAVGAGEAFPTGQQVAPAHPGCRCLALPGISVGD